MEQLRQINLAKLNKCINQTELSVFAGAYEDVKTFAISLANQYNVARIEVADKLPNELLKYVSLRCNEIVERGQHENIIIDCLKPVSPLKDVATMITYLVHLAKKFNVHILLILPCERHSQWRTIYFHLPTLVKNRVQVLTISFSTKENAVLIIERGEHSGEYIVLKYDSLLGKMEEVDG